MNTTKAGYTFLLLGLGFALLGYLTNIVSETWLQWRINHRGATAQGTVLSRRIRQTDNAVAYFVTYEFLTPTEQTITAEKQVNPDVYTALSEGSPVTVWYVWGDPNASMPDRPESDYSGFWIWFGVTSACFGVAAVFLRNTSPTAFLVGSGLLFIVNGLAGVFMALTGNTKTLLQSFNFVSVFSEVLGSLQMGIFITLGIGICLLGAGLFFQKDDNTQS